MLISNTNVSFKYECYLFFNKRHAITNFVSLCHSRNMNGKFKEAYLDRPTKIPHFLTPARIQKCLT